MTVTAIPRLKDYQGPALLSYGFRPFFFLSTIFSGVAVPLWLCAYYGEIAPGGLFAPRDWHIHEMIYGYVPAVLAGFLLTAIPNWTGRMPLQGTPLLVLVCTWLVGRLAILASAALGWISTAMLDGLFLWLLLAVTLREIIAGRNWRNLRMSAIVALLASGNLAFHLELHFTGVADISPRLGLAVIVLMISVVGGRIIPSFTRNFLMKFGSAGRLPAGFGRFDAATILISIVALALWVASLDFEAGAWLLLGAGVLQSIRLGLWAGERTMDEPLVIVLHAGYAFIPIGFLLTGLADLGVVARGAGIHAWAGAIALVTLAVMTRASLGHTGRPLHAGWATSLIYAAAVFAVVARITGALVDGWAPALLPMAGIAWVLAFVGFIASYGPMLLRPSRSPV
uniref:Putative NnrS family protein n=1 Tax=uncultured bacterium 1114 TaxID=548901 RepID=B8R960_9BACT|nr:putative NnrS family protein [uncultured bacterium 1114]